MRLEKSRSGMHHLDGRLTAQKKSAMKQKLAGEFPPAPPPAPAAVAVDYPKNGDRVTSRDYTFRVSAEAAGTVEISIDDEPWRPCRQAAGFWWHDWSGFRPGPHSVLARLNLRKGRRTFSARHDFEVEHL
jgi:hypothetical protein